MTTRSCQAPYAIVALLAGLGLSGCLVAEPEGGADSEEDASAATVGLDAASLRGVTLPDDDRAGEEPPETVVGTPVAIDPVVIGEDAEACLYGGESPFWPGTQQVTDLQAGESLSAQIVMPGCYSSAEQAEASCTITQDGQRLRLDAWISYVPLGKDTMPTADCQTLVAICESERLEAGDYELVTGDAVEPITVPSRFFACPDGALEIPVALGADG